MEWWPEVLQAIGGPAAVAAAGWAWLTKEGDKRWARVDQVEQASDRVEAVASLFSGVAETASRNAVEIRTLGDRMQAHSENIGREVIEPLREITKEIRGIRENQVEQGAHIAHLRQFMDRYEDRR